MAMDDFGSVLEPRPQQPAPAQPQQGGLVDAWRNWLSDPATASSLMQFGLAAMQPVAFGQTTTGHIANAVGQGMEAGDRQNTISHKRQREDRELELEERTTAAREQVAGASMIRATREGKGGAGGLSMKDIMRQRREEGNAIDTEIQRLAKDYHDRANDPLGGNDPALAPYKGLSQAEIALGLAKDDKIIGSIRQRRGVTSGVDAAAPAAPAAPVAPAPKPATAQLIEQYRPQWERARQMAKSQNPQERARAQAVLQQLRNAVADPDVFDTVVSR